MIQASLKRPGAGLILEDYFSYPRQPRKKRVESASHGRGGKIAAAVAATGCMKGFRTLGMVVHIDDIDQFKVMELIVDGWVFSGNRADHYQASDCFTHGLGEGDVGLV